MTASQRRRRWPGVLLVAYVAVLAVFLLLPTSEPASWAVGLVRVRLLDAGVPADLLSVSRAEFLANVAVFVPALALLRGVWPRLRWQDCAAYGFVASMLVEGVQAVAFAGRSATMADVVANTAGALLGGLLGGLLWSRRARRGRRQPVGGEGGWGGPRGVAPPVG